LSRVKLKNKGKPPQSRSNLLPTISVDTCTVLAVPGFASANPGRPEPSNEPRLSVLARDFTIVVPHAKDSGKSSEAG
jgi:hypothetical protein